MQSTMYLFQISNYDDPAVDRETVELLHQCSEFATMGIALPGAIAAKLIYPEKRVLTVTGDGGFMMNSQELETAKRLGIPIIVLIFNDCSYGLNMQRASGSKGTALKKQRIFCRH